MLYLGHASTIIVFKTENPFGEFAPGSSGAKLFLYGIANFIRLSKCALKANSSGVNQNGFFDHQRKE